MTFNALFGAGVIAGAVVLLVFALHFTLKACSASGPRTSSRKSRKSREPRPALSETRFQEDRTGH
jgi:hypothetical protein